ncbi:MAG: hypothetical protein RSG53_00740 [Oscillospiraceae bacterium]
MRKKLFYNGNAFTMSDSGVCEAIVTEGETIVGIGYYCDMLRLAGPFAKKVDLCGMSVVPFFEKPFCECEAEISPVCALNSISVDRSLASGGPADMIILNCDLMKAHRINRSEIKPAAIIRNGELVKRMEL